MGSPGHPVPVPRILNRIGWEREAAAPSSTGGGWGLTGRVSPPHLQSQKAAPAKSPERASRERDGGGPGPAGEGEGGGGCPAPCRRRSAENPGRCPRLTTRKGRKKPQDSRRSPPRCHRYRSFPTAQGAATAAAAGKGEGWRGGGSHRQQQAESPHTHTHSLTHSLALSLTHTHTTRARTTSSLQHRINGGTHARSAPCHVTGLVTLGPPRLVVFVPLTYGPTNSKKTTNPIRNCIQSSPARLVDGAQSACVPRGGGGERSGAVLAGSRSP